MTPILASTFNEALTKLSQAEAGAAMQAAIRYSSDPAGNGLQMHRIDKADGFWSLRASKDIRVILHKDGDTTTLAYVDHHDDAYAWAERKRIVPHERTGAMQIVEVAERAAEPQRVHENNSSRRHLAAAPELAVQPFWALTDDDMLDVGVPREWLDRVRETAEDDIHALTAKLPAEAAEALEDFATGGRLEDHVAAPVEAGADPFTHPDAQRRFRVLDNFEELQAALDAPFATWAVFLHPAQRELVGKAVTGPTRVSGSAGTGKTIVALHRAVHLARMDEDARVLLTTFSKPLAQALERKRDVLIDQQAGADPSLRERIIVRPLDMAAGELYTAHFGQKYGQPNRATSSQIRAMIAAAMKSGLGGDLTAEFLFEEWQELVDAWSVTDPETYVTIPRLGRRTRLGPRQREAAWSVFAALRQRIEERGLVTWAMIYDRLTRFVAEGGRMPFDHVVVDEAQDLTVAQVRFLAAVGRDRPDALFLAGDIGQRIFRLPFSWARLGLDIRGRSHSLKVNYRTSHQIRTAADRLLPPAITDLDGIEEGRSGTVSVFDGPLPDVAVVRDSAAECVAVSHWLKTCLATGIDANAIGLLVRSNGQLTRARDAIRAAGLDPRDETGVVVATMHGAKGLEFRAVSVIACDEDVLPDPVRMAAIGDLAELETAYETERHLLYVACTRARDRLLVSGIAPGSEFLDDLQGASTQ